MSFLGRVRVWDRAGVRHDMIMGHWLGLGFGLGFGPENEIRTQGL